MTSDATTVRSNVNGCGTNISGWTRGRLFGAGIPLAIVWFIQIIKREESCKPKARLLTYEEPTEAAKRRSNAHGKRRFGPGKNPPPPWCVRTVSRAVGHAGTNEAF